MSRMMKVSGLLLVVALAACSKKDEPPAAAEAGVATTPAAVTEVACHPQLQKLMAALPDKTDIEGQKVTDRSCKNGVVALSYGSGEPLFISYELTALQYAETDLEALGERGGQELLDNLRKTMEVKYTVLESRLKPAVAASASRAVEAMSPALQALQPREITLPNGAKAMVSTTDGSSWELDSVMSDRHMLVISWADARKDSNTDEAVAALSRLAAEVHYEKLK